MSYLRECLTMPWQANVALVVGAGAVLFTLIGG